MERAGVPENQVDLRGILLDTWVLTDNSARMMSLVSHLLDGGALDLGTHSISATQRACLPATIAGAQPWRSFLGDVPKEFPWAKQWLADCRAADARLAALDPD
jgi:hypothetical protein